MIRVDNGYKIVKKNCKCVSKNETALYKLNGKLINNTDIGFWECCNCGEKKPYRPHQKLFKLIKERAYE